MHQEEKAGFPKVVVMCGLTCGPHAAGSRNLRVADEAPKALEQPMQSHCDWLSVRMVSFQLGWLVVS